MLEAIVDFEELDRQQREVYLEYGSDNLYVLKVVDEQVDNVYDTVIKSVYKPYKVIGRIRPQENREQTSVRGGIENEVTFHGRVVRSSLLEQGIQLDLGDKIRFLNQDLELISFQPRGVIGDKFVEYSFICVGTLNLFEGVMPLC